MSTLEKAIGLLQEMPEYKLKAVYSYMRFVNSQIDDAAFLDESIIDSSSENISVEKRQKAFEDFISFAGTLPDDFDY